MKLLELQAYTIVLLSAPKASHKNVTSIIATEWLNAILYTSEGHSSVVKHMLCMHKVLGSILAISSYKRMDFRLQV